VAETSFGQKEITERKKNTCEKNIHFVGTNLSYVFGFPVKFSAKVLKLAARSSVLLCCFSFPRANMFKQNFDGEETNKEIKIKDRKAREWE